MPTNSNLWKVGGSDVTAAYIGNTQVYPLGDPNADVIWWGPINTDGTEGCRYATFEGRTIMGYHYKPIGLPSRPRYWEVDANGKATGPRKDYPTDGYTSSMWKWDGSNSTIRYEFNARVFASPVPPDSALGATPEGDTARYGNMLSGTPGTTSVQYVLDSNPYYPGWYIYMWSPRVGSFVSETELANANWRPTVWLRTKTPLPSTPTVA